MVVSLAQDVALTFFLHLHELCQTVKIVSGSEEDSPRLAPLRGKWNQNQSLTACHKKNPLFSPRWQDLEFWMKICDTALLSNI